MNPHIIKQWTEKALTASFAPIRSQARKAGRDFSITLDWVLRKAEAQDFRCAVTGIPFFAAHAGVSRTNPFRPSIDRMDNQRGYTADNVRIVTFAVNVACLDWGEEVLARVANAYRRTKKERSMPAPNEMVRATERKRKMKQWGYKMSGAVERSDKPGPVNDLAAGAGENAALSGKRKFQPPPHLEARRQLRAWSRDKPEHIRNLVWVICGQMRALDQAPHSTTLRGYIASNLERLKAA